MQDGIWNLSEDGAGTEWGRRREDNHKMGTEMGAGT